MYKAYRILIEDGNISITNEEGKLIKKYDENQSFRNLIDEFHKMLDDKNIKMKNH